MKLSIVTTLYQSSAYINEFYQRSRLVAHQLVGDEYEIIFVNDGSPDNSLAVAAQLTEHDPHIIVIDLSRNFGHHKAMMTGLSYAKGQQVFLLDSDLEEKPEWLIDFAAQMDAEQCDVVYGAQLKRKGSLFEKISGKLFYPTFRFFTGLAQPNNIVTARLMSRRYVTALLLHQERELNIGGLWTITGFKQCMRIIQKHATSPTTYSLSHKIKHIVNAVTSFSGLPLVFTFYSGLCISISALCYIIYLSLIHFFISSAPNGYTSIVASIWLFSGLIIFFIGLQGIYIAKIFSEVKQRPYTIVRHLYKHSENQGDLL